MKFTSIPEAYSSFREPLLYTFNTESTTPRDVELKIINRTTGNSLFLGRFDEMEIVGYTSRFSHCYEIDKKDNFLTVTKGYGSTVEARTEGIRRNNLFGTYLLGPFLIQNPLFTKMLLEKLGVEAPTLAFEEEIFKAYNVRLNEFKRDIVFAE